MHSPHDDDAHTASGKDVPPRPQVRPDEAGRNYALKRVAAAE